MTFVRPLNSIVGPMSHDFALFDLDGTISDPVVGIGRSINFALSHFGFETRELSRLAAHIGPPLDDAFRSLCGTDSPELISNLVLKYRERYGDIGYAENELYPGVLGQLIALHERGVRLGICTSKRVDFAEKILRMFGLRHLFSIVDGGEIGKQKWQQVGALLAAELITRDAVMIGDRAVDLTAAHRSGLSGAGVLWGHGSQAELAAENPRYLLKSPSDLAALPWSDHSLERAR